MNDTQILTAGIAIILPVSTLILGYFIQSKSVTEAKETLRAEIKALGFEINAELRITNGRLERMESRFERMEKTLEALTLEKSR